MKNSKNSTTTTVGTAKQSASKNTSSERKVLKSVTVAFGNSDLRVNAGLYEVKAGDKTYKVLVYKNLTLDAYLVALPQTGLKAQGSKRVLAIAKGDSKIANMRVADLAIAKLEKRINSSARGIKWDEYINNEVVAMTKPEFVYDESGKVAKDANGKAIRTGNVVAKYPVLTAQSEGLKASDERILNGVQKYFDSLLKKQAKLDSEKTSKVQPKAEKKSA